MRQSPAAGQSRLGNAPGLASFRSEVEQLALEQAQDRLSLLKGMVQAQRKLMPTITLQKLMSCFGTLVRLVRSEHDTRPSLFTPSTRSRVSSTSTGKPSGSESEMSDAASGERTVREVVDTLRNTLTELTATLEKQSVQDDNNESSELGALR